MKRLLFCLLMVFATLASSAQETLPVAERQTPQFSFGYFSYNRVLEQLPDYELAQRNLKDLKSKYDQEMKRVEDEFNKKYELFLENQRDFAPSILQKRQAELQELMEKNMAFKQQAQQMLKQAEADAMAPIKAKIDAAVTRVGQAHQFAFIINTDGNSVPFINPTQGLDVTENILSVLQ